jgi:hypothetical protein
MSTAPAEITLRVLIAGLAEIDGLDRLNKTAVDKKIDYIVSALVVPQMRTRTSYDIWVRRAIPARTFRGLPARLVRAKYFSLATSDVSMQSYLTLLTISLLNQRSFELHKLLSRL